MNRLRILVADDHEIVRRGLVALIKGHPDWEVCAEAGQWPPGQSSKLIRIET